MRRATQIEKDQVLVVLEAMKVQMRLLAPQDGVAGAVRVQAGDVVADQAELVLFEALHTEA